MFNFNIRCNISILRVIFMYDILLGYINKQMDFRILLSFVIVTIIFLLVAYYAMYGGNSTVICNTVTVGGIGVRRCTPYENASIIDKFTDRVVIWGIVIATMVASGALGYAVLTDVKYEDIATPTYNQQPSTIIML